jgi:hypothetical protein
MLHLTGITLREIRLPLREPFQISSGTMTERRCALLELRDASGAVAWSECVADDTPNYTSETIDTAWMAITKWVAPRVLFKPFQGPGEVHAVLEQDFRGHMMAKAAVEMGMWGGRGRAPADPAGPAHRGDARGDPGGDFVRHPGHARKAGREGRGRARRGLSQDQDQDQAGEGRGPTCAPCARRFPRPRSWPTPTTRTRSTRPTPSWRWTTST